MNTTLTTTRRHETHPSTESIATTVSHTNRVGLLDRAALHLGVALIKWGRRPAVPGRERRATRLERALVHQRDRRLATESLAADRTVDHVGWLGPLR